MQPFSILWVIGAVGVIAIAYSMYTLLEIDRRLQEVSDHLAAARQCGAPMDVTDFNALKTTHLAAIKAIYTAELSIVQIAKRSQRNLIVLVIASATILLIRWSV